MTNGKILAPLFSDFPFICVFKEFPFFFRYLFTFVLLSVENSPPLPIFVSHVRRTRCLFLFFLLLLLLLILKSIIHRSARILRCPGCGLWAPSTRFTPNEDVIANDTQTTFHIGRRATHRPAQFVIHAGGSMRFSWQHDRPARQ